MSMLLCVIKFCYVSIDAFKYCYLTMLLKSIGRPVLLLDAPSKHRKKRVGFLVFYFSINMEKGVNEIVTSKSSNLVSIALLKEILITTLEAPNLLEKRARWRVNRGGRMARPYLEPSKKGTQT